MRLALKLVNRSLSLNWGYAPVSSFDKSLFYQDLFSTLKKKSLLPMSRLALVEDPRNLSIKWLTFRSQLTPLAGTEKNTISGFDIRLSALKGPKKIKEARRLSLLTYSKLRLRGSLTTPTLGAMPVSIGQGQGWGVRSSRSQAYLRQGLFLVFKKTGIRGFLSSGCLPRDLLVANKEAFFSKESVSDDSILSSANLLVSFDVNSETHLLVEKAFFDGKGENPNLTPQTAGSHVDFSDFNGAWGAYLSWASGATEAQDALRPLALVALYKSALAKRAVSLSC